MSLLRLLRPLCLVLLAAPVLAQEAEPLTYSSSLETKYRAAVLPADASRDHRRQCAAGELTGAPCRFQWESAFRQSARFLFFQHLGNRGHYDLRPDFVRRWVRSVEAYRFTTWHDGDDALTNWVGHPLGGAVVGYVAVQNQPAGSVREFGADPEYWKSRARATAWIALYSAQWELGPASETSFGNFGSKWYVHPDTGHFTNGTGMIDLVVTPAVGAAWMVAEDAIDRHVTRRLERVSRRRVWLYTIAFLTPARSAANLLRFKPAWYRDTRDVRRTELAAASGATSAGK